MNQNSLEKKTILAVDDKPENLKVLIKYLADSGFELMIAQSGEEALDLDSPAKREQLLAEIQQILIPRLLAGEDA